MRYYKRCADCTGKGYTLDASNLKVRCWKCEKGFVDCTSEVIEDNATLQAALSEQSKELADVRGFVRDLAQENAGYGHIADWIDEARKLARQWDASAVATATIESEESETE